LLITNVEEKKEWVKTFNRKFAHFARNAPILLSFDSSDWKSVEITAYTPHRQTLSFEMDFEMDVSTFISHIRERIEEYYPVISYHWEERRDLSSDEITKVMMDENISFDEALNRSAVEKHETQYRIDKVFNDSNSVVLTNMETGESVRYQVFIPVAYLVDRIIYDESNTTAADILMQNATPISKDRGVFHDK
jgi:hypothetical protein